MTKRNATSLIELLVVMSACTIILTMSASLVHRAMRAQSATRSFFDGERSAMRLSQQFRADVHAATTTSVRDDSQHKNGVFLQLHLADGQEVEYRHADDTVTRVVSQRGTVMARAEFAFPSPLELAIHEEQSPQRLVLTASAGSLAKDSPSDEQQPPSAYALPLNLQVEACLDRDIKSALPTASEKERP